jgi:hypothetical protein
MLLCNVFKSIPIILHGLGRLFWPQRIALSCRTLTDNIHFDDFIYDSLAFGPEINCWRGRRTEGANRARVISVTYSHVIRY